jgi:hypothetical protein
MEFNELVDHGGDLAALARSEGFAAFAFELEKFLVGVRYNRETFATRAPSTPPAVVDSACRRWLASHQLKAGHPPSCK